MWNANTRIRISVKLIMTAVFGSVLDAGWGIYRAYRVTSIPHDADALGGIAKTATLRLYEAERNVVMGLFVLFLFMLIYRFQAMVHTAVKLARELEIGSEKYQEQDQQYKKLLLEQEQYEELLEKANIVPVKAFHSSEEEGVGTGSQ